jgi:CDP-6-deoxy-D-xylo-4-hexulose-3-dehydrase
MTPDPRTTRILELVAEHARERLAPPAFDPAAPRVPCSGRVFGAEEVVELVRSSLDFWLTAGPEAAAFERKLRGATGHRHALLVNSGSSANLLAVSALTSPRLRDGRLRPGDEVITVAAGFPTTVNPILQNGLVPVFVDVTLPEYNIDVARLEEARSERTRAVMVAHTLGNPFDLDAVSAFCERHGLWLIEDCCDALGSTWHGRNVGTFGDLATLSFYPAHQITLGEGGAVLTDRPALKKLVESFRDWGRDCWCEPGAENTCGQRFGCKHGSLPFGSDHKYVYSHLGYNLKATDMQAAIGLAQLDRLAAFVAGRRANHAFLREALAAHSDVLILPEETAGTEPSWFGFAITIRPDAGFTRRDLVTHLHASGVDSRQLFGGNLLRQPAYAGVPHRVAGGLETTDLVAERSFWIGCYPGLDRAALEYVTETFAAFRSGAVARAA